MTRIIIDSKQNGASYTTRCLTYGCNPSKKRLVVLPGTVWSMLSWVSTLKQKRKDEM